MGCFVVGVVLSAWFFDFVRIRDFLGVEGPFFEFFRVSILHFTVPGYRSRLPFPATVPGVVFWVFVPIRGFSGVGWPFFFYFFLSWWAFVPIRRLLGVGCFVCFLKVVTVPIRHFLCVGRVFWPLFVAF